MTYPILPVLGVTLSLTFIAGSVMAIPNFVRDAEPKKLGNIDITSLWTSRPVPIDRSKQSFERLPALVVQRPETARTNQGPQRIVTSASLAPRRYAQPHGMDESEMVGEAPSLGSETAVAAWCAERYRSYRASDNTYQPYGVGRRQCEPPFAAAVRNTTTSDDAQYSSSVAETSYIGNSHTQWCFARYRSYNPGNNTYRAFSGEIRSCLSPYI
jgi:hypothetical protein